MVFKGAKRKNSEYLHSPMPSMPSIPSMPIALNDDSLRPFPRPTVIPTPSTGPSTPMQPPPTPDSDSADLDPVVVLGVVAMEKKTASKPMKEILDRMRRIAGVEVRVFPERTILASPPDQWPPCDALLSFFSKGFPLQKAIDYAELRKPFVVNDLKEQILLQDREHIHAVLERAGVDVPRYEVLHRDPLDPSSADVVEELDSITLNGVVFHKPFVEKPIDAEDHNVFIYYPSSTGGGSQRLFRKIGSRSSIYSTESKIRRDKSYIYEEFTPTDGKDIKIYVVGPHYAHAESRKSPALDGVVQRDEDGKELRYPVILKGKEKQICTKIVSAFKQNICGFDLLRTDHDSYVVDVNGMSFVKNSSKYYDDCAQILSTMIIEACRGTPVPTVMSLPDLLSLLFSKFAIDMKIPPSAALGLLPEQHGQNGKSTSNRQLRCVVAVVRHADRTPKQKIKITVDYPAIYQLFQKHGGETRPSVKLKHPALLQEFLVVMRSVLNDAALLRRMEADERATLSQIVEVLEQHGSFRGVYRKAILKRIVDEEGESGVRDEAAAAESGAAAAATGRRPLMIAMKWGGELTSAGKKQAESLGRWFRRTMYPDNDDEAVGLSLDETIDADENKDVDADDDIFDDSSKTRETDQIRKRDKASSRFLTAPSRDPDLQKATSPQTRRQRRRHSSCEIIRRTFGLLRLHSTSAADLKIYASDEGRVQMTAAAFTKGLLELEGQLTPILAQMVKSANTDGLLDNASEVASLQEAVKTKIHLRLETDEDFTERDFLLFARESEGPSISIGDAMREIVNPRRTCERIAGMIEDFVGVVRRMMKDPVNRDVRLYHKESLNLMYRRWEKLKEDFKRKGDGFRISKIPDIYDSIKYDFQHNRSMLIYEDWEKFLRDAKSMADLVVPMEYGITVQDKLEIGRGIIQPLMRKIYQDLSLVIGGQRLYPQSQIKTRFYFTSESHIHSLLNVIYHGEIDNDESDDIWRKSLDRLARVSELNYLSQIVIKLYEISTNDVDADDRFQVELHFSSGTDCDFRIEKSGADDDNNDNYPTNRRQVVSLPPDSSILADEAACRSNRPRIKSTPSARRPDRPLCDSAEKKLLLCGDGVPRVRLPETLHGKLTLGALEKFAETIL